MKRSLWTFGALATLGSVGIAAACVVNMPQTAVVPSRAVRPPASPTDAPSKEAVVPPAVAPLALRAAVLVRKTGASLPATTPPLKIRYLCLTITSRLGKTPREKMDNFFHGFQDAACPHDVYLQLFHKGIAVALDADGEAFLAALRARYPSCDFQKNFIGEAEPGPDDSWAMHRRDAAADASEVSTDATLQIKSVAWTPDAVLVAHTAADAHMQRWAGTWAPGGGAAGATREQAVGRTYAEGNTGPGAVGEQVWPGTHVLLVCLLPDSGEMPEKTAALASR